MNNAIDRKQIEFEDDIVIVYDESGKEIYKGAEDYEIMKDEPWKWSSKEKSYSLGELTIICLDI